MKACSNQVEIGQVWEFSLTGLRCIVVAKNDSREAGENSWVMTCFEPAFLRWKTTYMHLRSRSECWKRIPLHRLVLESITSKDSRIVLKKAIWMINREDWDVEE